MPCKTITVEKKPAPRINVDSIDMPGSINVDETFDITASVSNTGDATGAGTVTFTQDGSQIGTGYVELDPGESKDVVLENHSISSPGDYQICANYRSGF